LILKQHGSAGCCARGERPHGSHSAERGHEIPPSDTDCHLTRPQRDHVRCMNAGYHAGPLVDDRRDRFQGLSSRASGELPRRFMTHSGRLLLDFGAAQHGQRAAIPTYKGASFSPLRMRPT